MTQYLTAKFDSGNRTYAYHNNGVVVFAGDRVKLPDPRSDGWLRGTVVDAAAPAPTKFETKGILGRIEDVPEPEPHKADCGNCYGNGCLSCGMKGTVETDAGREAREDAEDRRADEYRERRLLGDD